MSFKNDLNNIHDKSYKDLLSTKDAFLSFVNTFVKGEWSSQLEKDLDFLQSFPLFFIMVLTNGPVLQTLKIL
ncbi:hypothetical protein [Clostridium sp.]|uniref:hypothetical protein n=1 Tax=Clostridium sp. TaxID=1506 RepID=UPI003D6D1C88